VQGAGVAAEALRLGKLAEVQKFVEFFHREFYKDSAHHQIFSSYTIKDGYPTWDDLSALNPNYSVPNSDSLLAIARLSLALYQKTHDDRYSRFAFDIWETLKKYFVMPKDSEVVQGANNDDERV